MWEKIKYYVLAAIGALATLAAYVTFSRNNAASKAAGKIAKGREADATHAEKQRTAREILEGIDRKIEEQAYTPPARSTGAVVIELRKRGAIKE